MSGYTDCACRDCFDVAISSDEELPALCWACADAGCNPGGHSDCERHDAYGALDYAEELDFEEDRK